tara:strand:+ start:346 stop:486 length:141 start_codon:yes stop_codon:yes gene_type:complete
VAVGVARYPSPQLDTWLRKELGIDVSGWGDLPDFMDEYRAEQEKKR